MARPVTQRPTVRADAPVPQQTQGLGVYASLDNVVRSPGASNLAALGEALGVLANTGAALKARRDDEDYAQGKADQTLNRADKERMKRQGRYADGVFEVATLGQYHDAEAKVTERAATELDHSLPADQQVKIVDGWMQQELGGLAADAKARKVIASRYQQFIDSFAGNVVTGQAEARVKAAVEIARADIYSSLDKTGTFNYSEQHQRLTAISGDGTASTRALMQIVAQRAEEVAAAGGDYEAVYKQIPTEIVTESGQKLPSPLRSPENAAIINNSREKAAKAFKEFQEPAMARREMDSRVKFDAMLRDGQVITREMVDEYADVLPEATRAQYIDLSLQLRAKRQKELADEAAKDAALKAAYFSAGSWKKAIGLPGGPENMEQAQKLADGNFRNILKADRNYASTPDALSGASIVTSQSAINAVVYMTEQEDLPYTPLKNHMSAVKPASPGFVLRNLDAYRALKARGLESLYVDDEAALLYEVADGSMQAGDDPQKTEERIRTMGDKDTRDYVARELPKLKTEAAYDIPVVGNYFDGSTSSLVNQAYIQGRTRALTAYALENQMAPSEARTFAQERMKSAHYFLPFGDGKTLALPKATVRDPEETAAALEWWTSKKLAQYAKDAGVDPEDVSLVPQVGIRGTRAPSFQVVAGGVALTDEFDLEALVKAYRHYVPRTDPRKAVEERQKFLRIRGDRDLAPRAGHE